MSMYTRSLIPVVIFVTAACFTILFCDARADDSSPFPLEQITVYGTGVAGPYRLERQFIGGTLEVERTSIPGALAIVTWDTGARTITFDHPLAYGDTAIVILAVPPKWLRKSYTRSIIKAAPEKPSARTAQLYRKEYPRPFPGLSFGGSKTFDVTTGTARTVALNQTLRLNISGNITDDTTLNAAISDQNIPITPEGDTRELNELDRVLIEIRSKHFSVDMGDTDLKRTIGRWQSYDRRLSGGHFSVYTDNVALFGSGAVSEGRYMSATITPVEGNQGPYRLIAGDGNSHISVVPGTESVWINGEQLTRGLNYDYTIDYTTGEITFAESRIIGSDMRIVCDYEYTTESYRRSFFSGGGDGEFFGGRLKIGMLAAREADDPDRSVYGELDDAARDILRASGDSQAAVSGVRPAEGDSTGTYELVDDHFVYNPLETGSHNVTFSWVGENDGTYRYRGGGIYEFVPEEERGPGSGASYKPIAVINGPVTHSLAGVNVSFDPSSSLHIETELAGSSFDLNSLSGIDDSDNEGGAYRVEASLSPKIHAGIPLHLEFGGKHHARGKTFRPLDRDRNAEENRRWGLPLVSDPGKEAVTELSGGLKIEKGLLAGTGISFNAGSAGFGDSTSSSRLGGESRLMFSERGEARIAADHIVRKHFAGLPDETIDRFFGEVKAGISGFTPSAVYEGERTEGTGSFSHGTAYDDIRIRSGSPEYFRMKTTAEWLYRVERTKNPGWADSSTVKGGSVELSTGSGVNGSFRARYARRERKSLSQVFSSDQALLEGYLKPGGGKSRIDWSYRAGRSREASRRRNYIYIGGGRGAYRWEDDNGDGVRDPDEFIPDEHGSYYLYEETLDDYKPVNVVHLLGRVKYDIPAGRFVTFAGTDLVLRTETSFEVNEKSTAPAADVFLLKPGNLRKAGLTTSGDARFQQDITVPLYGGNGSVRLRYFHFDSYNAEFVSGAERKGTSEQSIRLRLPVSGVSDTEVTLTRSLWKRTMEQSSSGDFEVRSLSGDAGFSYYLDSAVSAGITLGGGYDNERKTGLSARFYSLKPSFTYRFHGRGKVETSYILTSVILKNTVSGDRLPYTMARGRKEGENHDISVKCDYRVSNRINIVATYTGRKFADRDFENFAQAQIRTLF